MKTAPFARLLSILLISAASSSTTAAADLDEPDGREGRRPGPLHRQQPHVLERDAVGLPHEFDVDFEIDEFYRRALETERLSAADALEIQRAAWAAVTAGAPTASVAR